MKTARPEPSKRFVGATGRSPSIMNRLILTIIFIFISPIANALETISLNIGTLAGSQWKLEGINIALTDLTQNPQKLALTITKLSLPKPYDDLNLVNIRCTAFTWQNKELLCEQGRAQIQSKRWQSPAANFSFHVTEKRSSFKLADLHLAGGTVAVEGVEQGELWQLQINAKAVDGKLIQQLLPQERFKLKAGKIDVKLNASGSHARVQEFTLTTGLKDLTGQTKDGRFATEALLLETTLSAKNIAPACDSCPPLPQGRFAWLQEVEQCRSNCREGRGEGVQNNNNWQWQNHVEFSGGALYVEPLYREAAGQNIVLDAQGDWSPSSKQVEVNSLSYRHSKAGELSGSATVKYKDGASIEKAELSLNSDNLQDLSAAYLKPFFEQTVLQGVSLAGHLKANISIIDQALTGLAATFNHLDIKDAAGRGKIKGGTGMLNWSNDEAFNQPSEIAWQQLQVRALPIGSAKLSFLSRADSIRLLKKTLLPFLGGAIAINQFSWQAKKQQDPELSFEGDVSDVSLEQLTGRRYPAPSVDVFPESNTATKP